MIYRRNPHFEGPQRLPEVAHYKAHELVRLADALRIDRLNRYAVQLHAMLFKVNVLPPKAR